VKTLRKKDSLRTFAASGRSEKQKNQNRASNRPACAWIGDDECANESDWIQPMGEPIVRLACGAKPVKLALAGSCRRKDLRAPETKFRPRPSRSVTGPLVGKKGKANPSGFAPVVSKALGDCYLLAVSHVMDATLVTFDQGLASACRKARQPVRLLEPRALAGG
jgi:hypothetical protein